MKLQITSDKLYIKNSNIVGIISGIISVILGIISSMGYLWQGYHIIIGSILVLIGLTVTFIAKSYNITFDKTLGNFIIKQSRLFKKYPDEIYKIDEIERIELQPTRNVSDGVMYTCEYHLIMKSGHLIDLDNGHATRTDNATIKKWIIKARTNSQAISQFLNIPFVEKEMIEN